MKQLFKFVYILGLILLGSCVQESEYIIIEIDNPFPENSMFPNVFESEDEIVISYIHSVGDTLDQLFFSSFKSGMFSKPKLISEGKDWFVNWADIPAIAKSGDNLLASWLDKSAEGTYDYDIKMSLSNDGGSTWEAAFIPHKDGISAEHGFVSIATNKENNFQAIWLDGRNTKLLDENGKEIYGQMTMRSAIIHPDGSMTNEQEIDPKVCDCCQTAILDTDLGTFAVYRDRSDEEIRDNYFSIFDGDSWSEPKVIQEDNWMIAGCPVNGPVIASMGKNVATAWYTESNGRPEIYFSMYEESEMAFSSPILISDFGVMGRLDLEYFEDGRLMVIWLEDGLDNNAIVKAKVYSHDFQEFAILELGECSAARSSGFPKIIRKGDGIIIIFQDIEGERLTTKMISY